MANFFYCKPWKVDELTACAVGCTHLDISGMITCWNRKWTAKEWWSNHFQQMKGLATSVSPATFNIQILCWRLLALPWVTLALSAEHWSMAEWFSTTSKCYSKWFLFCSQFEAENAASPLSLYSHHWLDSVPEVCQVKTEFRTRTILTNIDQCQGETGYRIQKH